MSQYIRSPESYQRLKADVTRWMSKTSDLQANAANFVALVADFFEQTSPVKPSPVNWVGFYFLRPWLPNFAQSPTEPESKTYDEWLSNRILAVGPFRGKAAVPLIPIPRGVCGQCIQRGEPIVVPDVHSHPDHIACDESSQAELVVPIYANSPITGKRGLIGLLDMDAQVTNFFSEDDVKPLQECLELFVNSIDPRQIGAMFGRLWSRDSLSGDAQDAKDADSQQASIALAPVYLNAAERRKVFNSDGPICETGSHRRSQPTPSEHECCSSELDDKADP